MRTRIEFSTLFVRLYVLMVALAFGLGAAFLLGKTERFSEPSLAGMRNLVGWLPVAPHILWGAVFLVFGLSLIGALGRSVAVHVLRGGMVIYLFMVTGLVMAPFEEPKASLTGIVVYMGMFGCHAVLADHLAHRGWASGVR